MTDSPETPVVPPKRSWRSRLGGGRRVPLVVAGLSLLAGLLVGGGAVGAATALDGEHGGGGHGDHHSQRADRNDRGGDGGQRQDQRQ